MTYPAHDRDDSPFAVPEDGVDIFFGAPDLAPPGTPDPSTRKGKGRRKEGPVLLVAQNRALVTWLCRVRYATRAQIQERWYPLDQMPTRQAVAARLAALQAGGWIEKHPGIGGYPIYQPTVRAYNEVGDGTRYHPNPSLGTMEHTLRLTDLIVELETGRHELPAGYPTSVTVLTEREITAEDKAPPKMRHRAGARSDVWRYQPVYGYLSDDGKRRGFPDALVLPIDPAEWESGQSFANAIAVEYERSEKPLAEYRAIIRAYRDTTRRTAPQEAVAAARQSLAGLNLPQIEALPVISVPRGGRYRYVLYVCETPRIKVLVERAALDLRVGDFVLTMLAPPPRFNRSPERTTKPWPPSKRGRPEAPLGVQLMRLPKARLVDYLLSMGAGEAALEVLTSGDGSGTAA
ncbi:hypothetical protein GB931_02860 [Modestobacter sp. I12A-02628]|uniref:Uncharacterized protein n=1 Tax=Goekera deserti TaxID=2497753 RepID=A0A7K3WD25_9ACTN|nr:hypothetical protein [Goekera deserti]MPQ96878.1 hypothetical protein [Goekera deserti]NDI46809.1 hypothetical protein [Goekera deserti]NEL54378.1 hypothetical protein [Goekera deserti]